MTGVGHPYRISNESKNNGSDQCYQYNNQGYWYNLIILNQKTNLLRYRISFAWPRPFLEFPLRSHLVFLWEERGFHCPSSIQVILLWSFLAAQRERDRERERLDANIINKLRSQFVFATEIWIYCCFFRSVCKSPKLLIPSNKCG